jgi:hypothetical protein
MKDMYTPADGLLCQANGKGRCIGSIFKKRKQDTTGSCLQYNNVFQVARKWRARTSTCGAEISDFLETLFFMVKRGWLLGIM